MQSFQVLLIAAALTLMIAVLVYEWHSEKRRASEQLRLKTADTNMRRAIQDVQREVASAVEDTRRLRRILDQSRDAVLVFAIDTDDTPSAFQDANDAACRLLECTIADIRKLTPMDIELIREPEIQRQQKDMDKLSISNTENIARDSVFALRAMQRVIKNTINGETVVYESSVVTQTGRRVPVEISVILLTAEKPARIAYIVKDFSAQQRMEAALRGSEQRFKDFFNAAMIGAAIYDAQHRLVMVNSAALRIFGSPHKDDFAKFNPFESKFIPENIRDRIRAGENVSCESVFDFDNMIASQGFVTNRRDKASLDLFFQNLGHDRERNPVGHLIQLRDITDLRETETALQLRDSQLRQAQKMEAIGTMTGGIAHDFNNILTPILGYAEIGLEVCDKSSRLYDFIKEIRVSTLRAKELVHQILVFSRQSDEVCTQIHLGPIIKEVAKQQSSVLQPKNIVVNYAIRSDSDLVMANPTQIHQILTNFATNSAYAMKEKGGQLDIQLSRFSMGWRHRQEFPQLKKGSYLRISVKDTGTGIPESIRERVFAPFFSTKPTGEGTGMGLAVVKGIVDSLDGGIALESKEGEGTTIHVALPLVDAPKIEESTVWEAPPSGGQRVLFVDDELSIATMATPMLTSLGYHPVVCTASRKALEIFADDPDAFDLLISDQVMPEMTGAELVAAIRKIRPELPVVICSGFSGSFTAEVARGMGINAFLVKPVSRRELGESIAHALNKTIPAGSEEVAARQPPETAQDEDEFEAQAVTDNAELTANG
jgi:signal transduction histidine kinase/FixJ family two-component response regulator